MRGRIWIGAAVAAAVVAAAAGQGEAALPSAPEGADRRATYRPPIGDQPFSPARPYRIDGIRLTGGGQTVVIAYIGGACDGPPRVQVTESAAQVMLTVWIAWRIPPGALCDSVGIGRTIRVRLSDPLGDRVVIDGARLARLPVVTSSSLLRPGWLPAGYQRAGEWPLSDATLPERFQHHGWSTTWSGGVRTCARPMLRVAQGDIGSMRGFERVGTVVLRGTRAIEYRQRAETILSWSQRSDRMVATAYAEHCHHPAARRATLLRFVDELR